MRCATSGLAFAGLCAALLAIPAVAQSSSPTEAGDVAAVAADVDALATEAGALAHARKLSADSDLSAAASALEAYLISDEKSAAVRAEYAVTLCRLDDMAAGKFEGAKMVAMGASPALLSTVTAACGKLPDPAKLALGEELPQ
jgi:hypothetical protein